MKSMLKVGRIDIVVAVLSGVVVASIAGAMVGHVGGAALGFVVAFLTTAGRQRQRKQLQARIDRPAALQWEVVVNDVRVGTLSDAHYAALEKAVIDDWRLYGAQAWNLAKVCKRVVELLLVAGPMTLFWLGLALVFFDPESASSVLATLRTAPPAEIISAAGQYATRVMTVVAVPMCLFALLSARRFGYENKFQTALGGAVRRRVNVAAEGRTMLMPALALRAV